MMLPAYALGLGAIKVRSNLGQAFLAQADLLGSDLDHINPSCWRARVVGMDGVLLASVLIAVQQNQNQRSVLFSTKQHINEPAVVLIIDINCETQLHREFSILLDPADTTAFQSTNNFENSGNNGSYNQANSGTPSQKTDTPAFTPKNIPNAVKATVVNSGESSSAQTFNAKASKPTQADISSNLTPPERLKNSSAKRVRHPRGDVLRLSDEAILPEPDSSLALAPSAGTNSHAGLRMSDVLSSQTGKALLGNMQELRAAQARMAAILRDEAPIDGAQIAKVSDTADVAHLKLEAEKLKKQNLLDRSSLEDLQKNTGFDFWLIVLTLLAVSLSAIIVMLLVYIQRRTVPTQASWWEDDPVTEPPLSGIHVEDAINQAQSSYENSDRYMHEKPAVSDIRSKRKKLRDTDEEQLGVKNASVPEASEIKDLPIDSGLHRTPTLEETNSSIFNFYSPRGGALKVEEISDVTQEAEFWISMNDPQRAIEILSAQEQVDHPDSPVPWLFLLDLYRTTGNAEKHHQLRERFLTFFNASIPEFDEDLSHIQFRQLEDFAHLLENVCDKWGSREVTPYLQSLLIDDRDGRRTGFDLPVYRDILMLLGVARELDKNHDSDAPMLDIDLGIEPLIDSSDDPVDQAQFGSIEFDSIDFPETNSGRKSAD